MKQKRKTTNHFVISPHRELSSSLCWNPTKIGFVISPTSCFWNGNTGHSPTPGAGITLAFQGRPSVRTFPSGICLQGIVGPGAPSAALTQHNCTRAAQQDWPVLSPQSAFGLLLGPRHNLLFLPFLLLEILNRRQRWIISWVLESYLILMFENLDFRKEVDLWAQMTEMKLKGLRRESVEFEKPHLCPSNWSPHEIRNPDCGCCPAQEWYRGAS